MTSKPTQLNLFDARPELAKKKSILVFELWGDLGHFKKPYTTTSPLSYAFPPRPTIAGIIAAIIGLGKNQYAKHFSKKNAGISLRILKPVKKIRISHNLIDTKKALRFSKIKQRTQIRFEYVKMPHYKIYFQHKDAKLYQQLKTHLENHSSVYTVSLGLSELLCNFKYIGEYAFEQKSVSEPVAIHSILPEKAAGKIDFETGKEYFSESMALEMDSDRIVTEFGKILYERNGQPIRTRTKHHIEVSNGDNILFL